MNCPRCGGTIQNAGWPPALAAHDKRCRRARAFERAHFASHGAWPRRSSYRGPVPVHVGHRSAGQSLAARKIVES